MCLAPSQKFHSCMFYHEVHATEMEISIISITQLHFREIKADIPQMLSTRPKLVLSDYSRPS